MAVATESRYSTSIHPLHAALLAGTVPLFLGAALSDIGYASTYEIQWTNFASWLIVAGLIPGAIALVFAVVDASRPNRRAPGIAIYVILVATMWVVGLFNALIHARDAWGSMPAGLLLSIFSAALAGAATWFGFATPRIRRLQ